MRQSWRTVLEQLRCITQSSNCHTVAWMKVNVLSPKRAWHHHDDEALVMARKSSRAAGKEPGDMRGEAQSWSGLIKAVANRPLVLMDPGQRESFWTHKSSFWESLASTGEVLLLGLYLRPRCSISFCESWGLEIDQIWVLSGLTSNPTALSKLLV